MDFDSIFSGIFEQILTGFTTVISDLIQGVFTDLLGGILG